MPSSDTQYCSKVKQSWGHSNWQPPFDLYDPAPKESYNKWFGMIPEVEANLILFGNRYLDS